MSTRMRKLAWAIPLGLTVLLGCSPAARERVMHFFFEIPEEGVPQAASEATQDDATPTDSTALPELVISDTRYASLHPPVQRRQCDACHDASQQMKVRADLADSCATCHPRYFSDDVGHDPVSSGDCATCHLPHRSELLHLLRQPVYNTCTDCHDEPADLSEEAHGGEILESGKVKNCTECHDPHFGTGPLLRPGHGG